jgi:Transposase DDE domain.
MNIQEYSVALATSLESNKNPSAVAREVGTSQSTSSRFLRKLDLTDCDFIPFVHRMFGKKKLNLVIDDGCISKRYSEEIEGVSSMIDQSTKTFTNGYKIIVAGLTDGEYFLPIAIEQWIAEFIMQEDYLKVTQLAEKLILRILELNISIEYFVMDGLYFSIEFIKFLNNQKLKFIIKAKTTTAVIYKGQKIQLQNCSDLRLNSNQDQKKIFAEWSGQLWYFIAVRRSGKRGPKIIYLIANFKTKSRLYAKAYDSRWKIEKFFRTSKQSLGLSNSFSLEAKIYLNHMKCVFFAYCLLQLLMKKLKLDSIEDAIRKTQSLKYKYGFSQIVDRISLLENYA